MTTYQITGNVTENDVPVSRRVKAYKGDKSSFYTLGEKVADGYSDASGAYTLAVGTWAGPTFVIAIDDETPPNYDPGAVDWVVPELTPPPLYYYNRLVFDAPQALWRLDDAPPSTTALDFVGILHGVYENGPNLKQADVPYDNASFSVAFNGTDQAVVTPSVLSPIAGADFTLEFAFKTGTTNDQVLFASRAFTYPSTNYIVLTLNKQDATPTPGMITLELADGAVVNRFYTMIAEAIGDNAWHHIVVIKQGSAISFIYDGKTLAVTGTLTLTGPVHNGANHVFARAPDQAPGCGLGGLIYALPLWFSALTAETAKVHFYLLRRPVQYYLDGVLEDFPDRAYVLEEYAIETVALDLSGADAHGTYVGAAPGGAALVAVEPMATSGVFAGTADRVEIDMPFSATVETTAFTFECWFQTTRQARAYITDRSGTTNRVAVVLNEDGAGADGAGYLQCFISPSPGLVYRVVTTGAHAEVYDGLPHHLGIVYDHPDVGIVLDGQNLPVSGAISAATVLKVDAEAQYVGASAALDAATGFVGNISHFMTWASALSVAQLQSHFTQGQVTYRLLVLEDNPEAYWTLGDLGLPVQDETGSYILTEQTGLPGYGAASILPQDSLNTAIDFNGNSNFNRFSGPIIHNRAQWTLEAWLNITAWPPSNKTAIASQCNSNGAILGIFLYNGEIVCQGFTGSWSIDLRIDGQLGSTYHIVFTKDATGHKAYINGALYDSTPSTTNAFARDLFSIGREGADGNPQLNGIGQHVACYYHALTQERIIAHYQKGYQGALFATIMDAVPDRLWILGDQLNVPQAVDHSGNAVHGTYRDGATSGGVSLQAAELYQLSASFQAANNSRVEVPAVFSSAAVTDQYSLQFWFQTTKTGIAYLWDRAQGVGLTQRVAVRLNANGGSPAAGYIEVSHRTTTSPEMLVRTSVPYAQVYDGAPHFLAVTFNYPTVGIYLDGVPLGTVGTMTASGVLHRDNLLHYLGVRYDLLQAEKFEGQLSFAGVWDGVTLAGSTISDTYSVGAGI